VCVTVMTETRRRRTRRSIADRSSTTRPKATLRRARGSSRDHRWTAGRPAGLHPPRFASCQMRSRDDRSRDDRIAPPPHIRRTTHVGQLWAPVSALISDFISSCEGAEPRGARAARDGRRASGRHVMNRAAASARRAARARDEGARRERAALARRRVERPTASPARRVRRFRELVGERWGGAKGAGT
jgi:hypothetical protein